jgi:hypothetical protein
VKHVPDFSQFLDSEVNLNPTRINTLRERVVNVETFLNSQAWPLNVRRSSPQGSWAHKTIIKPPGNNGFDADLVTFVDPVVGWRPSQYISAFHGAFRSSGIYKDKVGHRTRCVTLEYAGDFELDVVPCVVSRAGLQYLVCNCKDDLFEETDSEAYTSWFNERCLRAGGNNLREVTRLLKYLRDTKLTFSCKSILLTTLIGMQVGDADVLYQNSNFPDLPTSLRTIVGRLDHFLQARAAMPEIRNPILPAESFTRHWDQDKYANFREMVHTYRGWIDDAYAETDEAESIKKWRRLLGDEFAKNKGGDAIRIAESASVPIVVSPGMSPGMPTDVVEMVKRVGRGVLASLKSTMPWIQSAPWRMAQLGTIPLRVTKHTKRFDTAPIGTVVSGEVAQKDLELRFEALMPSGASYAQTRDFDVQWQVVNTDRDAWRLNALRGGFYSSHTRGVRWERTQYHGAHWVEAFLIRKRDRVCVARSGRFFVVIE